MFDFDYLKSANKKVKEKTQENQQLAQEYFDKGYKLIGDYFTSKQEKHLRNAAEQFASSLEFYGKNGKAYFWLGYIFYLFGKDLLCFEYMQVAEELEPEYEKLVQFKAKFNS